MIVQHREHEPQVAGDRRLAREQSTRCPARPRSTAAVDVVVEGDHLVRELGVLAARPRRRREASAAPARPPRAATTRAGRALPGRRRASSRTVPSRSPRCACRPGLVKIFDVWSYSTRMPLRLPLVVDRRREKNAVMSATRAACCMLCVTITIVYSRLSSCIRSSIRVRRDRVERRGRLVHQDHVRLDGEAARDAEPLLLAA